MSNKIKEDENNVDISENEANIIKRTEPQFVFSIITRYINLINDSEKQIKKETVIKLHKFICLEQPYFKRELVQEILVSFNGNLIKYSLFNEIDKVREFSLKILIYLYANCVNITKFLPFIFSALANKLQCDDLEGYGNMPEDIRPTPSQNPQKIIKVTENIEEIRILYLKLLEAIINHDNSTKDDFRLFVQDIVNITRTLCMDPAPNVVIIACNFCKILAENFGKDLLYYFNSILSRGILYALSHKQAKLRIAALEALDKLMYCSPYKKNVEIMEQLIGFRDPNVVPIKDFYEPTTKFNYLAFLSADTNQSVLIKFYDVIFDWLLNTEDRVDHESRLIPYVLTGLFNKNEIVANYVLEKFIEMGELHEKTNAKDYREQKEYGVDAPWIKYINQDKNYNIPYPSPIKKRPGLGCRKIVLSYIRRYIKNLTKEFEGIDNDIKYKVANLLLYSIVYSEEGIVEYLDGILLLFMKDFLKTSNSNIDNLERNIFVNKNAISLTIEINDILIKSAEMIGIFCDFDSFSKIIYPTIKGDLNGDYQDIQRGAIITLKHIFIGHCDFSNDGLGIFKSKLHEFFTVFGNEEQLKSTIDSHSAYDIIDFYDDVIKSIKNNIKKYTEENLIEFKKETEHIFLNILQALGAIDFLNNSQVYKYISTFLKSINENMKVIMNDKDYHFFNMHSIDILKEIDKYLIKNYISLQHRYFKILYLFLNTKDLFFKNLDTSSASNEESLKELIVLLFSLFNKIYINDENFNVHSTALNLIISFLNSLDDKFNYICIKEYKELLLSILKPYTTIDTEEFKFKFIDLLKEQKELDKKKMKNPKTLKTELRRNLLLYIKNLFNKSEQFKLKGNANKENINIFLCIFNDNAILQYFIEDSEPIRLLFINIYYLYLVKYFVINEKSEVNLPNMTEVYEKYFLEMVYDNNIEIRKMSFTILNVVMGQIPKSQFYDPMKNLFKNLSSEVAQFQMEAMKAMSYIDTEKKEIEKYFHKFKDILSSIINESLNEKVAFGTVCNNSMKLIIERFPIYIFSELVKAQKKNQLSRIEFFDTQLKRNINS